MSHQKSVHIASLNIISQQTPQGKVVKQIIQDIAAHLPEQATFDDAMYAIYVCQKLEHSLRSAEEGNITSQEEMEKLYLGNAR